LAADSLEGSLTVHLAQCYLDWDQNADFNYSPAEDLKQSPDDQIHNRIRSEVTPAIEHDFIIRGVMDIWQNCPVSYII